MPRPHNVPQLRLYNDIAVLQREQDTAAEGADQQQHSEDKHLNASGRSPRKVAYPAAQNKKRRRRDGPRGLQVPRQVDQHAGMITERPRGASRRPRAASTGSDRREPDAGVQTRRAGALAATVGLAVAAWS